MSSFQMEAQVWNEVQGIPGNETCVDCGSASPEWASVSHGILICLECSGSHRGLGTHISFVRSIKMDSWSEKQIQAMKLGGNQNLNEYLEAKGIARSSSIREKYDNDTAQLYKFQLKARIDGQAIPTDLPPPKRRDNENKTGKYQGFGSAPSPPKSSRASIVPWAVPVVVAVAALIFIRR